MELRFNKYSLIITFILFLGILPATNLLGLTFPWQYIIVPFLIYVVMFISFKWVEIPRSSHIMILLWVLIIFEVLFSGIFSPMLTLGSFNIPTESVQYVSRFLFFITFIALFYNYKIDYVRFMYIFAGILALGMMVAVVQFFNFGPLSNLVREMYVNSDSHIGFMMRENLASKRISGVAHHATANGGIAAFTLIIVLSLYFFHKKKTLFAGVGIFLAIFNVVVSQARMGYLTVAFAALIIYFVYNYVYKKSIRSTLLMTVLITSISGLIYFLYTRGNEFVTRAVFRWEQLGLQVGSGENRVGQINYALSLLDTPFEYLFGISRGVQNSMDTFHMEVEPVNIFVLYGSVGFVLHYSLIIVLLFYFFRNMKFLKGHPILLTMAITSFVGLLSYQFFSTAYFFFRETYVGLFPWILMGSTIGAVEKFKRQPEQFESYSSEVKTKKKRKRRKIVWS